MNLNNTDKSSTSATILIETRQITSNLETADGLPVRRYFLSTAWDLQHDRPIDQRITCGGTLAKATIKSPEMLTNSPRGSNCNSSRCHLRRSYQVLGVPHEVLNIRNGCVWLRPIELIASAERETASTRVREEPVQTHFLHKPHATLTQQPSAIQRLVSHYAESMYLGAGMNKAEASRRMQSEIQFMNVSRRSDDQLKIPPQKTICLFIDEYLTCALSDGLAARRSIIKVFSGVNQTAEQSPPKLEP